MYPLQFELSGNNFIYFSGKNWDKMNHIELQPRVPDKKVIGGGGIFLEPLNILSSQLNFTLNLTASTDNKWGSVNEGVWNGMIGMVVRGEADIAAASLTREAIQKTFEKVIPHFVNISMSDFLSCE